MLLLLLPSLFATRLYSNGGVKTKDKGERKTLIDGFGRRFYL
jgi:hypothetical protein